MVNTFELSPPLSCSSGQKNAPLPQRLAWNWKSPCRPCRPKPHQKNQRKPKGAKNYYALSFDLTFCATKAFNMQMTKWASWGHGHWLCLGRGGFWLLGSEVWSIGTFAHFINVEPNGGVPFPIPLAAN